MNKKVLFITYENPFTKNTGDSIYSANIIEALFDLKANVDIVYFDSNASIPEIDSENKLKFNDTKLVRHTSKNITWFVLSNKPGMYVNRYSTAFLDQLELLLRNQKYDAIFVNHLKMVFTLPVLTKYAKNTKLNYISHNVEYLLSKNLFENSVHFFNKIINWQDSIKIGSLEKRIIPLFDNVTAICEHDRNYFLKKYKAINVEIIRPLGPALSALDKKINSKKINYVILAGSFIWGPKIENLLSLLNAKNFKELGQNNIVLKVVGRASQELVNKINSKYNGVEMTGDVLEMRPYYDEAKIAVIPEKLGGGFKLKVVEAASYQTAIFAINGAIKTCDFKPSKHYIEKNTFEELISEIIKVQQTPEILEKMIGDSSEIVQKYFTKQNIIKSLKKII
ncbi:glycosyltransferase [Namhaeicola litoreus]|uniref:Glycosyltransferase n=1 Tax=Namhaeicola litoreus TaxID=1052145 RepID=A0ABW3Y712_9FLAO